MGIDLTTSVSPDLGLKIPKAKPKMHLEHIARWVWRQGSLEEVTVEIDLHFKVPKTRKCRHSEWSSRATQAARNSLRSDPDELECMKRYAQCIPCETKALKSQTQTWYTSAAEKLTIFGGVRWIVHNHAIVLVALRGDCRRKNSPSGSYKIREKQERGSLAFARHYLVSIAA